MREGKWTLTVSGGGSPLPEHTVECKTCVESQPGSAFEVKVEYAGSEMHQIELLIDGKQVSGRRCIDGANQTTFPHTSTIFKGWEKSYDGQCVTSDFVFVDTQTAEEGGEDQGSGIASAPADWSRGVITLRVYGGVRQMIHADCNSVGHTPDLRGPTAVNEKSMVKGGHSASAGAGNKNFTQQRTWRAGESCVGRAAGDPLESEHSVFFRDSFWLLLRGDKDKVMDAAGPSDQHVSEGVAKARSHARRHAETTERLAKRVKGEPDVIDLC